MDRRLFVFVFFSYKAYPESDGGAKRPVDNDPQFIHGTMAALRSWLLTIVPTPMYLSLYFFMQGISGKIFVLGNCFPDMRCIKKACEEKTNIGPLVSSQERGAEERFSARW